VFEGVSAVVWDDGNSHKYLFWCVFKDVIYRGRCWYTYDFVITYRVGGTSRYVGYTGYKVCDPAVANPRVQVYSDFCVVVD
jgi:hypothetical protein